MMFNPPTHRDSDFKTRDTEFSALVPSLFFFSSGMSLLALLWLLETIYFWPNCSQLIIWWFAQDQVCRFLCPKPIKYAILIVPLSILIAGLSIVIVVLFCAEIKSFFCLEDVDFNTILRKVSTRCLILLLILKPDFETPDTEFSHLVPSLDYFIGSVTVGSTVCQLQPIVLRPRVLLLIIGFFMQFWSCLLLRLQPIKHAILVVGLFWENL